MQTYSDVQSAIDRLALALKRAADGQESPPTVDFDLSWINVTSIESKGQSYEPVIKLTVTREEVVHLKDL